MKIAASTTASTLLVEMLSEELVGVCVVSTTSSSLVLEYFLSSIILSFQLLVTENLVRLCNVVEFLLCFLFIVSILISCEEM